MAVDAARFREFALSEPGAVVGAHGGHADFRIGKVFASLPAPGFGMVKLTPHEQELFMAEAPDAFFPAAGSWGAKGYTRVALDRVDEASLRSAIRAAAAGMETTKR